MRGETCDHFSGAKCVCVNRTIRIDDISSIGHSLLIGIRVNTTRLAMANPLQSDFGAVREARSPRRAPLSAAIRVRFGTALASCPRLVPRKPHAAVNRKGMG